jgi:cytochrome c556
MTDDERAIRDLVATWMKASETGDVNTVLSLMADDVIFVVPGREPFGKEEFRAASEAMKNGARAREIIEEFPLSSGEEQMTDATPLTGSIRHLSVIWERTAESGTLSEMRPSAGRSVPELQAI